MAEQLVLDVYAGDRIRRPAGALIAERLHQRGWITLPYDTAGMGNAGTVVPAWLCCLCGGVEPNAYLLHINHGCCAVVVPSCPPVGHWSRDFDAHWTPYHPRGQP